MKKGTNSASMRRKNEKVILSLIKDKPMPRVKLASTLGLTKAAITIIVDELLKEGLINEIGIRDTNMAGRNPIILSFDGSKFYAIGINIGRQGVSVGICNLNGKVISERKFGYTAPEVFFDKIFEIVDDLILKTKINREKIQGVGVVTPGPVSLSEKKILNPTNFEEWHNVNVVEELKKRMQYDIFFSNISSATAITEKYFGKAKQTENFVSLLVNKDGIGMGIVLNNSLFEGNNEIGHTSIMMDGRKCECGSRGCLEKYATLTAITEGSGYCSWADAVNAQDNGLIEKECDYLATAIINIANVLSIDKVILNGDIVACKPELIVKTVSKKIENKILCRNKLKIEIGESYSDSLVPASLAVNKFFNE